MDLLTGGYQQIRSGQEIYSLSDNILKASSGGKKDTLTFL
ncbi:MAG: hypothetical protein JWP37_1061 [Mucilaginibacter sp.]|nr:hypothetical protein [Mucilaginibacter sp.]